MPSGTEAYPSMRERRENQVTYAAEVSGGGKEKRTLNETCTSPGKSSTRVRPTSGSRSKKSHRQKGGPGVVEKKFRTTYTVSRSALCKKKAQVGYLPGKLLIHVRGGNFRSVQKIRDALSLASGHGSGSAGDEKRTLEYCRGIASPTC